MKNTKAPFSKCGIVALAALIVILGWETLTVFKLDFAPVHDYAADMLLANLIRDEGVLLVGHYSRFGFHHPGPFWFYWNHILEMCFTWLGLTRFQIWTLGSVIINAALLFFSARGLSQYLFDKIKYEVVFILTAVLLVTVGGDFLATWMPDRLVATYIAFFVCLVNISRANLSYLPWAVVFAAMLVHGYVTMPVLTLPPMLLSFAAAFVFKRHEITKHELAKRLLQSSLIAIIFIAPLAIDALLSPDSNLTKIIAAQNTLSNSPKPSWSDLIGFYNQLVFDQPYSIILYWASLFAIVPLFILREWKTLTRLVGIVFFYAFITALIIAYYKTTPAPLYPFVARFYVGLPAILIVSVWCALVDAIGQLSPFTRLVAKTAIIIALVFSLFISKQHVNPIWADPEDTVPIRSLADHIQQHNKNDKIIVLNYSQHEQWGIMAGLMLELDRRQIHSCTTWAQMGFLYTQRMICAPEAKPDFMIVKSTECKGECITETKGLGLMSFK